MRTSFTITLALVTLSYACFAQRNTELWDLDRCIQYAVENNITIKQSELTKDIAENNLTQAQFSRLPNLSASGSQSLTKGTSIDPITSDFVSQTVHSTSLSVNSQVTLFAGNKINNTIKQYSLTVQQNNLYIEEAKNSIILSVAQAYLQAFYYKEGIETAEYNLATSEKQVQRSQALLDAGSVSLSDLSSVKATYAGNNYSLVAVRNQYAQQVLTLKQLLEMEPEQPFELTFPEELDLSVVIPDKLEVYHTALESMPEIKASKAQVSISALNVRLAKASYYPTLYLSGSLSSGYTNTQEYTFSDQLDNNFNQGLSLTLSIPIFNNWQTKANVKNSALNAGIAELSLVAEKKDLYQKIENAHQSAISARAEMEAAAEETEAAKTALDLAMQKFDLGSINAVDLLVSQNTYIAAQQKYLQTKYTTILYYQLLQFYQGNSIKL